MVVTNVPMLTSLAGIAVVLMVIGVPLWLVFLTSSVVVIYYFTTVPMNIIASTMFSSLDNFVLLAVPGFIFVGEVMAQGGMANRLIRWLRSLVGPVPGGVPITTLAAGETFGAISGSSAAATAAIGKTLFPALRQEGYTERFSFGLIASSGAIAIIIPPSISMILYAAVGNVSLGRLFMAGFVPGILFGAMVAAFSVYTSYTHGITKGAQWRLREIADSTRDAAWTLGLPVIIFGGIYGGFVTPTEVAAVAAAYAVFVSLFVYDQMDLRKLWDVTLDAATLTSKIFLITAAAGLFSWVLTIARVPQSLAGAIAGADVPVWAVLMMINVALILAGMFIDPVSNVLVLTPILLPITTAIGVDPIHFGIIMVVNMAIGMFTPPFGLNIFVVSSVFGASTTRITRGLVPFFVLYFIGLILITYVPAVSLWLPDLIGV